jgi:two-component system, NarL family, sensor kinase
MHAGKHFNAMSPVMETRPAPESAEPAAPLAAALLDQLAVTVASFAARRTAHVGTLVSDARDRALAIGGERDEGATLAAIAFGGDVLSALAVERALSPKQAAAIMLQISRVTGLPLEVARAGIHMRALRDPMLLELPPQLAVETHLSLLHALAPVDEASLWTADAQHRLRCIVHQGPGQPGRRTRALAREMVQAPRPVRKGLGLLEAVPILRWQQACGVLIVRCRREERQQAAALTAETATALAPVLERQSFLHRGAERERALVEAAERRLERLGFDLHDGAIQEVIALGAGLHALREHVATESNGRSRPDGEPLVHALEGLTEQVASVERELRTVSHGLGSPAISGRPLRDALETEVDAFRAQCDANVVLDVHGDFSSLTASQRIALLRIAQEGLANVREHSGATEVSVSVAATPTGVQAELRDDGCGFDVEHTLVRAARSGRLGLVGMSERARLLGGRLDVQSQPGGPTTIVLSLPFWEPSWTVEPLSSVGTG